MRVRTATRDDLHAFGRIGLSASRAAHPSLTAPSLRPNVLKRCLLAGTVVVAEDADGRVVGFTVAERRGDHVVVASTVLESSHGAPNIVRGLFDAIRKTVPELPFSAEILLGDIDRERALEAGGFVPGEVEPRQRDGVEIVTRRWWAEALC